MNCDEVGARLDAYIDEELSEALSKEVGKHLDGCAICSSKAEALRDLTAYLNDMPKIKSPGTLAAKTLGAYRSGMEKPGIMDWWGGLSLRMRGVVCGIAMAGLVFGIVLGGSFFNSAKYVQDSYLSSLYHTEGVLP